LTLRMKSLQSMSFLKNEVDAIGPAELGERMQKSPQKRFDDGLTKLGSGRPFFRTLARTAVVAGVLALGGATGCAGDRKAAQANCPKLDWYEIGRRDGTEGRPSNQADARVRDCGSAGTAVDSEAYVNGRNAGLTEYCTAAAGLEAGRTGQTYRGVCPEHLEKEFLQGYEAGGRILALEEEQLALSKRIDQIFRSLNSPVLSQTERPGLRLRMDELSRRRARLGEEISTAEKDANTTRRF
jgi:hypothetical protein